MPTFEEREKWRRSPGAAATGRSPLSTAHSKPKLYRPKTEEKSQIIVYPGASRIQVKTGIKPEQKGGGQRGKINQFSRGSRRYLMFLLGEIIRSSLPYFATFTTPSIIPLKKFKRMTVILIKRIMREYPRVGIIIKYEYQKREAPHSHMLIWGVPLSQFYDLIKFCAENWYQIAGENNPDALKLLYGELPKSKPCVEKIYSWHGVMSYVSKYIVKLNPKTDEKNPGRFWSIYNKENIPWAVARVTEITLKQSFEFIRLMRRYAHLKNRPYKTLSILCIADRWASALNIGQT